MHTNKSYTDSKPVLSPFASKKAREAYSKGPFIESKDPFAIRRNKVIKTFTLAKIETFCIGSANIESLGEKSSPAPQRIPIKKPKKIESDFIYKFPIDPEELQRISQLKPKPKIIKPIKPLLVFGLAGTFYYYTRRDRYPQSNSSEIIPKYVPGKFRVRNYILYPRPGAIELLHYLIYDYKNVAIWSSAEYINAIPITQELVKSKEIDSLFKFIWCRTECATNRKKGITATTKPINKIINDKKINSNNKLKHSDVMIYEDDPEKVELNDKEYVRIIPTFDATNPNNDDNFLFELLNDIKSGNFNIGKQQ